MQENPDAIDAFLAMLGLEVEKPRQPQQVQAKGNLKVEVRFAHSDGPHPVIVHFVALGRGITEEDLEGKLLPGPWTFMADSLLRFSELYAFTVFKVMSGAYHPSDRIQYRVNPPMPTEEYGRVSYRLVPKLEDPKGGQLLDIVQEATTRLYVNQS